MISDIDGTITKSDVLGHLLPVIGRDWAQSGVAQLYTKIRNNGYQIIYLSARAIGQAAITKDYLQSLKQGDVCLPDGPLFLNPDSLIHAFKREVIDRNPEEFKIRCLKDIQSLFDGKNPFFAGYGNRPNVSGYLLFLIKYFMKIFLPGRLRIPGSRNTSVQNLHHQPSWRAETRTHSELPDIVSVKFFV